MSLESYYDVISKLFQNFTNLFKSLPPREEQISILQKMEPGRLYVENVRQYFNITTMNAEFLCEMGVKEGLFDRNIGLLCNNDDCRRIVLSTRAEEEIPDEIICETCEDFEKDKYSFTTSELDRLTFYTFSTK